MGWFGWVLLNEKRNCDFQRAHLRTSSGIQTLLSRDLCRTCTGLAVGESDSRSPQKTALRGSSQKPNFCFSSFSLKALPSKPSAFTASWVRPLPHLCSHACRASVYATIISLPLAASATSFHPIFYLQPEQQFLSRGFDEVTPLHKFSYEFLFPTE